MDGSSARIRSQFTNNSSWSGIAQIAHNNAQAAPAAAADQHMGEPFTHEMEQAVYDEASRLHRQAHRDLFPLFSSLRMFPRYV